MYEIVKESRNRFGAVFKKLFDRYRRSYCVISRLCPGQPPAEYGVGHVRCCQLENVFLLALIAFLAS
jgi:hypothetical protein